MPTQLNMLCQIPRLHLAWNTVKTKGSAGGIDGISILEFEKEKRKEILKLSEELKKGTWKPQPYMEIEVAKTKNPDEIRKLGMTDTTRQLLVKSVMERLARYEKYQGEEMKMEQIILRQTKLLAKAFDGTDKFKPYVAKW